MRKRSRFGGVRFSPAVVAAVLSSTSFLGLAPVHAQTAPGLTKKILQMERDREAEFESYFGEDLASISKTADQTAAELHRLSDVTGTRAGLCMSSPVKPICTLC